jgi:hypothetical protein
MAEYIPVKVQRLVLAASNGCCEYCWAPSEYSSALYHFDHILPVAKSGQSTFFNVAYSCSGCNGYKSDKTHSFDTLTNQTVRLYHPRSDVTKQIVPKADGAAAFNRCACSEYKLLKKLARKMGIIQKGDKGTNVTGTIVLACERDFCASCVKVMDQFETSMFKGIKFIRLEKVKEAGADSENGQ